MSVKASVSLTDQQDSFARALVKEGHYSSLSAVVQRGLELVRSETEREQVELDALRAFFEARNNGLFISVEEGRKRTEDMIAAKRRAKGL
ncbi:MAG: type II toxin-antitoxin system ParD family antitoxin [Roseovarius sp.]|nr:type II toxin-antitoxin system ParD family antitoxin [Roseovarius sp.]MCY4206932.1 type II toxin-antitoxin system ParD family antitoxin [Roseovarius sp.]